MDLVCETDDLFLALSFPSVFSAASALSSASSNSCCTLRYLARLTAAISSCNKRIPFLSVLYLLKTKQYSLGKIINYVELQNEE